jgi:hypothetical protein
MPSDCGSTALLAALGLIALKVQYVRDCLNGRKLERQRLEETAQQTAHKPRRIRLAARGFEV